MRSPIRVEAGDLLLTGKVAAVLLGVAEQTLRHARCGSPRSARHDLFLPPPTLVPASNGGRPLVFYALRDLQAWAEQERRPLRWHRLPYSHALPLAQCHRAAGLPLPAALAPTP